MAYCIVFVGSGDAGREIMAKAILDTQLRKVGSAGFEVKARGLVVLFQEPVNSKVMKILESNQVSLEYDCVFQLEQSDVESADMIITMDDLQKKRVLEIYKDVTNIHTLKELAGEEGNVLDPYGKELIDYEYCFREMSRLIEKIGSSHLGVHEE